MLYGKQVPYLAEGFDKLRFPIDTLFFYLQLNLIVLTIKTLCFVSLKLEKIPETSVFVVSHNVL